MELPGGFLTGAAPLTHLNWTVPLGPAMDCYLKKAPRIPIVSPNIVFRFQLPFSVSVLGSLRDSLLPPAHG